MNWILMGVIAAFGLVGQPTSRPESVGGSKPQPAVGTVGVLSFNIRYGTAPDKENAWPHRKGQVFDILNDDRLDFAGLQEALRAQLDDIHAACPKLGETGVGRDDGKTKGEYSAILYRTDRWKPVKTGTFWLSETPEVAGSKSWKTACTRICSWGRFERADTHAILWVFNTHMDHVSAEARLNGAKLIAARIAKRGDAEPFVLTGDFNSGEDEEAARYFLSPPTLTADSSHIGKLLDTFRVLRADDKEFNTFHAFDPTKKVGKKIDYILVPPDTKVIDAWIDRRSKDGRAPSDHFPVGAIIEYERPTK